MTTGMLWLMNQKLTLVQNVKAAATHYCRKYGRQPELCLVNPGALKEALPDDLTVTVRPWRSILPNHLWIGVEEMPTGAQEAVPA